ncbi:MAG: ribonuclease Z [Candidatus Thorarchaeota archaeon]|nr:ribonuclease Z [Candidatus Thorarchaeota archaeon]
MEVVFLGTGGAIPTEGRKHPAIVVAHQGWNFLLDCGEYAQMQLERAGIGFNKNMVVLVTHLHADHVLGLPGVLLRLSLLGRTRPLMVYGPPGLIEYVRVCQATINLGTRFESTVYGIGAGPVLDIEDVHIRSFEVDHRGYALGYSVTRRRSRGRFLPERATELGVPMGPLWRQLSLGETVTLDSGKTVRPEDVTLEAGLGTKIVYSGDTRPCDTLRDASRDADLLISEAMYTSEHEHLAHERGHMTAAQAASIAAEARVKCLVLTHFSPRYDSVQGAPILEEAREIFPNTLLAHDLMRIKVHDGRACESLSAQSR